MGENSPFLSALLKVYKKKVKRSKRKKGGEEEDFDEDEEDEDDEAVIKLEKNTVHILVCTFS